MSKRNFEKLGRAFISRREMLRWTGAGIGAFSLGGVTRALAQVSPDVHIRLTAAPSTAQILPGAASSVYQYTAELLGGPKGTLQSLPGSFLGPTIRLKRGQRVRIDFVNDLLEPSVTHFHGLHVPADADGHPINTVEPGGSWTHEFDVINQAGTYWYHAHTDMRTGYQVNRGLAGLLIVEEDLEGALGLPTGSHDIPLIIQDKRFNAANQIQHSSGSQSGHLGDRILINGVVGSVLRVGTSSYRIRLLNACNSRILKLRWSNGMPMTVIGTDGGLLAAPIDKPYLMLSSGERRDIYVDCSEFKLGTSFKLISDSFAKGGSGSGTPPQGTRMDILDVLVDYSDSTTPNLPSVLRPYPVWSKDQAVNAENSRVFGLEYMGMWTVNGNSFEMQNYTNDEIVHLNQLELWHIRNDLPGAVQQPHPMHFHGPQFQIASRSVTQDWVWYDRIREGYVDEGWHDTILAFPTEAVEILTKWTDYEGLFLYHCHNLEHEDMGMMRNLFVRS